MTSGGSNKKVANGLVAVSCAAVMAVYTAGYVRTRAAANQFDVQAAERRPPAQVAQVDPAPSAESRPIEPIARTERPSAVVSTSVNPVRPAAPEAGVVATVEPAPLTAPVEVVAVAPAPVAPPTPVAPVKEHVAEVVPEKPPAPKWKDGTFTGWGTSRHGDIQAEVMIEDGRIVSATIAQCLTRYSCSVIDMLPPQVTQRQSAEVDYVSRATESADAFYFAVSEALSKAK